jgi:inosine-uridine nucleoside N-ribohydrolase
MTDDRTTLILDVDTGIDDSLALLYAAGSPDADLLAVTCVSGNIDARQVAVNTRAVLELAGRSDVEVALGREFPLLRALEVAPETHGPQGIGYADKEHLHHHLMEIGHGHRQAVLLMYLWSALISGCALAVAFSIGTRTWLVCSISLPVPGRPSNGKVGSNT